MSNASVTIRPALSENQPLATRFSRMLEAFERSQQARADRVIQRFSYRGAHIAEITQNTSDTSKRAAAAPYGPLMMMGASQ